ncbi:MAG: hypothetical protein JWN03_6479 [Nocardia sp.]|nr:hypothetical protein [Nocardia sp.]
MTTSSRAVMEETQVLNGTGHISPVRARPEDIIRSS